MTRLPAILFGLLILAPTVSAADWQPLIAEFIKTQKPGFGGLCGMTVDHVTGDVFINVSDRGFYRSTDQGKTFQRISAMQPKGRTEWPGCFLLDPTGKSKRLVAALVYGSPIGVSADQGAAWNYMNNKSSHVDWCAVDWTDPEMKFVLALKHESGDLLIASHDGGKSFTEVGKGYGPAWIFDGQTAVLAQTKTKDRPKPSFLRTTDGGKTFKPCGEYSTKALPKWRDGTLYWVVDGALIATTDQGQTWKKLGDLKDGRYGPIFGKDAKQLFVLTGAGVVESTDGGGSWSKPLAPPKELKGIGALTWIDYDPKNDLLYMCKMGTDLFKLARGK